jgi:hypothetical protein
MNRSIVKYFTRLSDFLSHRKGLLPIIGIVLVALNFVLQWIPMGWVSSTHLFLHAGIILAIAGFLLAWAL